MVENLKIRAAMLLAAAALLPISACSQVKVPAAQDGDVIFQTSLSSQSAAVQRATHSQYSHMGIVIFKDASPYVYEASAKVKYTPLVAWIKHGKDRHFVLKRLVNSKSILTPAALQKMREAAAGYEGRPYDLTFEWTDDRMYCSELVWKVLKYSTGLEVGKLQTVKDFDLTDPAVKKKMQERYGDHVPLDETVISPASMYESPLLVTVAEG